jgi:hypothetical protein
MRVRIVDPVSRRGCPEGVEGEIWVAGDSVGRGYWGDAALSVETFEAFDAAGEGPFLRTGDLGRLDEDGFLYIEGRLSRFSKIGGETEVLLAKVGELETALALAGNTTPEVDAALAALRAQAAAGGRPQALTPTLLALAEAYPELRAQASFGELQRNLVETEQRIALARNYYNDSATFHNTRLERVPDRYVASLLKMQPAALFAATGFERAAVGVQF